MNEYINYIGISESLPVDIKYFKEDLVDDIFYKKENSKPIGEIISASIDLNINSIKLLNTSTRTSNEGRKFTGKKLLIEVCLNYSIKYTSNTIEKYLYILKNEVTKIMYISVPKEINNYDIEDFVRRKKIQIQSFVEDLYVEKRSSDSIYVRSLLLINANFKI
ncbi:MULTISPECIES: hypothetical protein [Peptostreptococcaceae]|uniref:hypothetical protein n=1 Tax=Peptostreptococcaceae TaxID=186804 RepID=UPI003F2FAAAE